uniref:Uncharacterized protein n=1 Tax=Siphoviridae sp. ct2D011 TaxID=2825314 RepID=A0A8S5V938_9CAUD|nr:MAG TPA: hypothetical protein [Siphoviridae sp. ct2D011]
MERQKKKQKIGLRIYIKIKRRTYKYEIWC